MVGDITKQELFERNRDAFKRLYPDVWRLLENLDPLSSPPPPVCRREASRIGFSSPEHCNLSPISLGLYKEITAYFREVNSKNWADYPVVDVGYAFIFGVGLGGQVLDLAQRNLCRHLIIMEPNAQFVVQSLLAVDWGGIFDVLKANDATLHFLISQNALGTAIALDDIVSHYGGTFLEGSYFYPLTVSPELQETETLVRQRIKNHYLSSGYFEDEMLMVRNCFASMSKRYFRLLAPQAREKLDIPIFLVGSGPSLDKDLPTIKKWRDRALVLSCGSALGVLLKNGIRPDLHVENENTPQLVKNLRNFHEKYGLEGIVFVATMTISSELEGLFDRWWQYFRPVLSTTAAMGGGAEPVDFTEPLVSNAGFAVCAELGFQTIHLFGVDCGQKSGGAHHSKDAAYYDEDYDNWAEGRGLDFVEKQCNRETTGNFGGEFLTSWVFDLSRHSLSACKRKKRVTMVNCSDGALIEGGTPLASEGLDFSDFPEINKGILHCLEESLPAFAPGEYLEFMDFDAHVKGCDTFAQSFPVLMDAALDEDRGFWQLEQRLEKFWADNYSELKGVLMVMGGSYASMVRLGAFFGNRIKDENARLEFLRFFIGKYRDTCLLMAKEIKALYQGMVDPS